MASKNEGVQPIADFDWDAVETKGFGVDYSDAQKQEMEELISGTLNDVTEKELITGTVVGVSARDVILNIGFKSDGLVPLNEFRDYEPSSLIS